MQDHANEMPIYDVTGKLETTSPGAGTPGEAVENKVRSGRPEAKNTKKQASSKQPLIRPAETAAAKKSDPRPSAGDLFKAALEWHARGYNVVPVKRPDKDGVIKKHPGVRWKKWQRERIDEETLRGWRGLFANGLGFLTGEPSGAIVVEADGPIGKKLLAEFGLPRTLTILSGSGRGPHYHFKHPGRRVTTRANTEIQIDVKGDGGFAVLPPSLHKSGGRYEVLDDAPVADLPLGLLEFIEAKAAATKAAAAEAPEEEAEFNHFEAVGEAQTRDNVDQRLRDMRYHGEVGDGVNETQKFVVRALLWQGVGIDKIVEKIVEATRLIAPEGWNWKDEEKKVRDLCEGWIKKQEAKAKKPKAEAASRIKEHVELTCARDVKPENVNWLWKGWLAKKKIQLLAGSKGEGKTTLALAIAATVSAGALFPDGARAVQGDVIIWSGEDSVADTIIPRLIAMGADLSSVHIISAMVGESGKRRPFDPSEDLIRLEEAIANLPNGKAELLVIDPFVSAVKRGKNSHNNAETRQGLQHVYEFAQKHDIAVIGIHHLTKGTSGQAPVERVTGSLAIAALARIILIATKQQEGEVPSRLLIRAAINIGEPDGGFGYDLVGAFLDCYGVETSKIVWGDFVPGNPHQLINKAEGVPESEGRTAVSEARSFLEEALREGEVDVEEIRKQAKDEGHSPASIKRAKIGLGIVISRTRKTDGSYDKTFWALPPFSAVTGRPRD